MISKENLTEAQVKKADALNESYFKDVVLSDDENGALQWLLRWDKFTIEKIAEAFSKVRNSKICS